MTGTEYIDKLAHFAARLRPDVQRLDEHGDAMLAWYEQFQQEGLNTGWSVRQPLSGLEFCRALATLALESGAFAFVALQQFVANAQVGEYSDAPVWPKLGVAFGHLGKPDRSYPVWRSGRVNGTVPWMSGAGIFDKVVLGMRDPDGQELFALVDAYDRPEFAHSEPLALVACSGTRTVRVRLCDLPVSACQVLKTNPPGSQARSDAEGVLFQTPLLIGCIQACWQIIRESPRVRSVELQRCEQRTQSLLQRTYNAFEHNESEQGPGLRAELGDYAVRIARLAVMASGGAGLLHGHPAQRLYREALIYTLMAQTDAIVNRAFEEVYHE